MIVCMKKFFVGILLSLLVIFGLLSGVKCAASHVAILPMTSQVEVDLPWDVAQHLTEGVRKKIANKEFTVISGAMTELDLAKDFSGYDYIVTMELIRYEKAPARGRLEELQMDVQVCVLELVDGKTRVVHQEISHTVHLLPYGDRLIDYTDHSNPFTPRAVAHARSSKSVAGKIEQIFAYTQRNSNYEFTSIISRHLLWHKSLATRKLPADSLLASDTNLCL